MVTSKLQTSVDKIISRDGKEAWHAFEIMAEFVGATEHLREILPAVAIFGSARVQQSHPYYQQAETIARCLSDSGFSVISGGGPGIMEAVNKGAFAGKSASVGLNIILPHEQISNAYQDVAFDFKHFFMRKVMFVKHASAYIVMPGGLGTLDEFIEVMMLVQTLKIRPIPIILVGSDFWQGLLTWFRQTLLNEGMIDEQDMDLIQVIDEPNAIIDNIFKYYDTRNFKHSSEEQRMQFYL